MRRSIRSDKVVATAASVAPAPLPNGSTSDASACSRNTAICASTVADDVISILAVGSATAIVSVDVIAAVAPATVLLGDAIVALGPQRRRCW